MKRNTHTVNKTAYMGPFCCKTSQEADNTLNLCGSAENLSSLINKQN